MKKNKMLIAAVTVCAMMVSMVSTTIVSASGDGDTIEHHFGTTWDANKTTEEYHYLICEDPGCSEIKEEAHRFRWEVWQFADETTEGYMRETCEVCGYQSGNIEMIPPLSVSPEFKANTTTWNGKSDIVFTVNTMGGSFRELGYSLLLEDNNQVDGLMSIPAVDAEGKATWNVTAKEIENYLQKYGFELSQLKSMNFMTVFSFNTSDKEGIYATQMSNKFCDIAVDMSQPEVPEYMPSLSSTTTLWTGEDDIVLDVKGNGGNVKFAEFYLYSNESSIGGIAITPEMQLDADGNGTITLKKEDIKAAKLIGMENENIDWSMIDQIELSVSFNLDDDYQIKRVYIPVNIVPEESQETVIKDESGVNMALPEDAPDNLELKVVVSDGSAEKAVIEKVIDVDGDKIKTFDLSLLLNNQHYDYNGQFNSTVSLPIPEGWDTDKLVLYYYNENTKEVTPVQFEIDSVNNTIIFMTNHFSKYVLAQKAISTQPNPETDNDTDTKKTHTTTTNTNSQKTNGPKTSDNTEIKMYVSAFLISVFGLFVMTINRKKSTNA